MKLSQLTKQDKIRLAAELDGWTKLRIEHRIIDTLVGVRPDYPHYKHLAIYDVPSYPTSYDAVIPLIQKQDDTLIIKFIHTLQIDILHRCPIVGSDEAWFMASELDCWHQLKATPSQLLDALLVATGMAEL